MPQLDVSTYASQLFWLVISFFTLYVALVKVALPSIREVLQSRQDRVSNDLEKADLARKEAETAKAEYVQALERAKHQAVTMVTEATASLKKESIERQARLDAELDRQLKDAETRIQEAVKQTKEALGPTVIELAEQVVTKLTGAAYDRKEIASFVLQVEKSLDSNQK